MFQNICELPLSKAAAIIDDIRASDLPALRPDYLDRRIATEDWLRQEKQKLIGETPLNHPIYFFLGDFADGKDRSRPSSIILQLSELPSSILTFTNGDSMSCFYNPNRRVMDLGQLRRLAGATDRLPHNDNPRIKSSFIEIQVWDSSPLEKHRN